MTLEVPQLSTFEALAARLGTFARMVATHTSKSVRLPVVSLDTGNVRFTLRDNFFDVNLAVCAAEPVTLPLSEFFADVRPPKTWEWYLEEINRCRGYTWRDYTDEEMDNPRILVGAPPSRNVVSLEKKERWTRRLSDPAWWGADWSGGVISYTGDFGPGVQLYVQPHPYLEGMDNYATWPKAYTPGLSTFTLALPNLDAAEVIMRRVARK